MSLDNIPNINEPLIDRTRDKMIAQRWWRWLHDLANPTTVGFTGTIVTAKLTPGGSTGTMFFKNGILTGQSPAT